MIRVCKMAKEICEPWCLCKTSILGLEKNRPKRNCPNKEQINTLIKEQEQKYSEQILDFLPEIRAIR